MPAGFAIAAILAASIPAQTSERYAWPLDLPRELTSSFGEYRPGRYHMGIDLRTGGVGKDVHAAADGYVSRIRCSPYGYGKAVYIQLDDGNSAVYAHLSDFSPALDEFVRAEQHRREEYEVDLNVESHRFPVKRDELIAKSGQTGIGVPHLHYELRDKDGVAINPRGLGVKWPDRTAPVVQAIAVHALTPRSLVDDYSLIAIRKLGTAKAQVPDSVVVEGPVGLSVLAFDPGSNGSRLGIYRATLSLDGREIFTVRNDRISYDFTEDGAIAFANVPKKDEFLRLWRVPGNDSEPYARSPAADGSIELRDSTADAQITVQDFAGNAATVTIPLARGAPFADHVPQAGVQPAGGNAHATIGTNGQWVTAGASLPRGDLDTPRFIVPGLPAAVTFRRTVTLHRMNVALLRGYKNADDIVFGAAYLPDEPFTDLVYMIAHPRLLPVPQQRVVVARRGCAAQRVTFGALEVHISPESAYGTLAFQVREVAPAADAELRPLGTAYEISPDSTVVDAPIVLSLPVPAEHPERALFNRRDMDKKKWVRQVTKIEAGRISASTRQLGTYALLEDDTRPQIDIVHPSPTDKTRSRRPEIVVRAKDNGSGVDKWRVTYNGRWLLTEYDPEQDLLTWERDEDLPVGEGTLAVEVRDHAGNAAKRESKVIVQP